MPEPITLHTELVAMLQWGGKINFKQGELLCALKKDRLYEQVYGGDGAPAHLAWGKYVASLGIPRTTADYKMAVYTKWIIELGYTPDELMDVGFRKLAVAVQYCTSREKADEILGQARVLSVSDFIAELTGKEPCQHLHKTKKETTMCEDCHRQLREE